MQQKLRRQRITRGVPPPPLKKRKQLSWTHIRHISGVIRRTVLRAQASWQHIASWQRIGAGRPLEKTNDHLSQGANRWNFID